MANGGNKKSLVVLGGSVCTDYGLHVTKCLVGYLAKEGVCIVSGLETKVSYMALNCSLDVGGSAHGYVAGSLKIAKIKSKTVDRLISSKNGQVYVPPNKAESIKNPFIFRDRVMVYRSDAVLVIEALMGSRIFNAIEFASKNNKQIFAVPGNVFNYSSKGTSFLLKTGAVLVENHKDIIQHMSG